MPWNPQQYDKFKAERTAPVRDLFAMLHIKPTMQVIDLGCGTGEHTATLASMLPQSNVVGIDSSAEMLATAERCQREGLTFKLGSFENFEGSYDCIFSNAALQWGSNHRELLPFVWSRLVPGGQLLLQMPKNQDHPSHRLARDIALQEFSEHLAPEFRNAIARHEERVLNVEQYAELLFSLGAEDITAFLKVYPHVLQDSDAIVEWVKGTLLIPYMEQLPQTQGEHFLHRYREELHKLYPGSPVFYGFKRILLSAFKSE